MARPTTPPDLRLLSKVSWLYYKQKLTQQDIAKRLRLSRPKVSRLLQQAEEEGIVQIKVQAPPNVYSELEEELENRFGLLEAVVVEADSADTHRRVGAAAAEHLQRTIETGDTIGISWGLTLYHMVNALETIDANDLHVVQLIGGLGAPESDTHVTEVCRHLAQRLNSKLTILPAPGIMGSEEMKKIIMTDAYVQSAFEHFAAVNVAYVGIGVPSPDSILMRDGNILRPDELEMLLEKGAVGDIALRFFDAAGQAVASELDDRVIGISLAQLKSIDRRVGVAGGLPKFEVVRAALQGGLVNILVTDQDLAYALLHN